MFGEAVVWVAEPESEAALSVRLCSRLGLLSMCCLLSLSQYETALSAVGSVLCSTVCGACGLHSRDRPTVQCRSEHLCFVLFIMNL